MLLEVRQLHTYTKIGACQLLRIRDSVWKHVETNTNKRKGEKVMV
jgi:hypothetical protein